MPRCQRLRRGLGASVDDAIEAGDRLGRPSGEEVFDRAVEDFARLSRRALQRAA